MFSNEAFTRQKKLKVMTCTAPKNGLVMSSSGNDGPNNGLVMPRSGVEVKKNPDFVVKSILQILTNTQVSYRIFFIFYWNSKYERLENEFRTLSKLDWHLNT